MPSENATKPHKTDKVQCTVQLTREQLERLARLARKRPLATRAVLVREIFEAGLGVAEQEAKKSA